MCRWKYFVNSVRKAYATWSEMYNAGQHNMLLVFVNNRAMYHSIDSVHKFETLFPIPHHQLNVDVVTFCVPK